MAYDLGTPSRYYCIVKEGYQPEAIDQLLAESDPIAATGTAAIVDGKTPDGRRTMVGKPLSFIAVG